MGAYLVGVSAWGMSVQGGSAQGVFTWGVSAYGGGGCLSGGVHLPQWTEFLTHVCENITFPQLCWRTVKMKCVFY